MIQVTRSGVISAGSTEDLHRQRRKFDHKHCVRLPGLLHGDLLREFQQRLDASEFVPKTYEGIGHEIGPQDCNPDAKLSFLGNSKVVFDFIERVTGCGPIGCFTGRVYRMMPGPGHFEDWHNDNVLHRMVALSINLSTDVFRGGVLQLRDERTGQITEEVANTGFGDGFIFRIAPYLKHRLTHVEGTVPKTSFVGWFRAEPDYFSLIKTRRLAAISGA